MTALTALKGIGDKSAALYGKIGIDTVETAVLYFPRDYITYEEITPGNELSENSTVSFSAVVVKRPLAKRVRRLSVVSATLSADGVCINATWFNMPYLTQSLKPGSSFVFRGILSPEGDHYTIRQPQIFTKEKYEELLGRINPVYSLTKGLTNNAVTNTIKKSFDYLGTYRQEVYDMHFPKDAATLQKARGQLVFDEFLVFILRMRLLKNAANDEKNAYHMIEDATCERIIEKLPYRLTSAQQRVWNEIKDDLCSDMPMRRLIQGDVGSGKTIIAMLAAIMTAKNGYQCAIMAPTEILAEQHFESLKQLLASSGFEVNAVLLTGSMTASAKKNVRSMIESGEASVIIGTHALFYDSVIYNNLALVITDEQHRFGVNQRKLLSEKNADKDVHVLVMSATPIPRTLAMILYSDLSISVIDEVPAHKLPIKNAVVNESYRKSAYKFMDKEIKAGHQVYVICPLIEESEGLDAKNVTDTARELSSVFDDNVNIGILHGHMKGSKKQEVMDSFSKGHTNILVSTTVVEVGVNVPNATVMMIENADRFGLAALHQLRGRIGRGSAQSYCIFMSGSSKEESMKRLEILGSTNDGFKIAEEDMKMRGPGDMFGLRQSGDMRFRLADIFSDASILKEAAGAADKILKEDPGLSSPENRKLRQLVDAAGDLSETSASI
ncbi:MAG: ATP-dependent DNA helicase RecG [Lachnospiraceae bacterium]|nr:ATP-dependent DNA helicase RecG [Lachnospiraceae bacterium]